MQSMPILIVNYYRNIFALLIITLLISLNANAFSKRKRAVEVKYIPVRTVALPSPTPFNPYSYGPLSKLTNTTEIVPIYDYLRTIEFSDLPEEYDIWSSAKVNPYQVDLKDMADTVIIDLSSYYPPSEKKITSNFGFRRWRHHYGIDLKVHRGDSIYNAFDGVVRITKRARDYGNYVVVRHFNGLETLYAHLNKITVKPGDTLKAGTPLGLGGSTGRSTGYHLHFEVRYLGNPINPNDIIDFNSHSVINSVLALNAQHFEYKKEIAKIRFWRVKSGDSLSRIAARTGISISKLCSLNGISRNSILRIGQRIRYT